jgi:hypothetical protein
VDDSELAVDLRRRVRDARHALDLARVKGDFYAADVREGELDSLRRVAMENGIDLSRGGDR